MGTRQNIGGRSSLTLYLALILALALAVVLAIVLLVVVPDRQRARETATWVVAATTTAQVQYAQAAGTAEARASELQRAYTAGAAFAAADDWDKAAEEYARTIALDPTYRDAAARLAEARRKAEAARAESTAGARASAERAVATATAQVKSAIETAYQRGLAYSNVKRWDQAKVEFEKVIAVDPGYKDVQARLIEVDTEFRKLTPTPLPAPAATPTPSVLLFKPVSAISFQETGTRSTDDTALVQEKDGYWPPSLTGSVTQDYFASGTGVMFFDASSLRFAVGNRSYRDYRAVLRAFVQQGAYGKYPEGRNAWNHYLALPGKENPDHWDWAPFDVPGISVIDFSPGRWIEIELSPKFWSEGDVWVTLRLWNIRVDAVELVLTPR